ncbi:hypothetical protein BK767_01875 [Bacillus thuringiensis serovar kyushuensis]|uniref:hypothetical protein n=1 Tax=Bacillus thuringiensis TaxID=1428 RepID=UPI000B43B83D|nr:hypothetical protein [Bacillus thuringiensis]MEC2866936.1 hypothetical protein [Bacillus cereus]OTZ79493.1 hypothetical protein BK767_01875 [Bacillus thuringiensis serovar kyushuensis]OTZ79993.1 hypothetical protein BK768_05885 [Bacillus thuringiensis serovar tohokuensis]OUB84871.1 hypothetical protein BK773_23540 [Bacillus thuringiensis serovar indiana]
MNNQLLDLLSKTQTNLFVLKEQKNTFSEFIDLLKLDSSDRSLLQKYIHIFENSLFNIENHIDTLKNELSLLDPAIFATVSGSIQINKVKYTFAEVQYSGNDESGKPKRGIEFKSGGNRYVISPNPHLNNRYNNGGQRDFYNALALKVSDIGDDEKWEKNEWPTKNLTHLSALGQKYDLHYDGRA